MQIEKKNNYDDRIKEITYRLDVVETERQNVDKKRNDLLKDNTELEKKIKKAKQDQETIKSGTSLKDQNVLQLQQEINDCKKKLEDLNRQKNNMILLIKNYNLL